MPTPLPSCLPPTPSNPPPMPREGVPFNIQFTLRLYGPCAEGEYPLICVSRRGCMAHRQRGQWAVGSGRSPSRALTSHGLRAALPVSVAGRPNLRGVNKCSPLRHASAPATLSYLRAHARARVVPPRPFVKPPGIDISLTAPPKSGLDAVGPPCRVPTGCMAHPR